MKKTLLAILTTLAALVGLTMSAAPAHAYEVWIDTDQATCTYDNPGVNPVASKADLYLTDDGRLRLRGELWNDGAARNWDWQIYHDGDLSFSGSATGGFTISRKLVDFSGTDNIRFRVRNDARTVDCNSYVSD